LARIRKYYTVKGNAVNAGTPVKPKRKEDLVRALPRESHDVSQMRFTQIKGLERVDRRGKDDR
jgi:hypothetical protein